MSNIILNEDYLAFRYRDWYKSNPFDIGTTVRSSISMLDSPMQDIEESFNIVERETRAYDVKQTAKRINKLSRSNGGLMRIGPMAVWLAEHIKGRDDARYETFKTLIKADLELTHSDELSQQCCLLYSCAIAFLLNNPKLKDKGKKCFEECLRLSTTPYCNYKTE